ncbi:MAG: zinc ribbon domain-containing protein [Lachnospiraceae bacterium]|nr:zinc ribbon domain-containing protein [Lachnospiraceae bacterium]
MAIIKCNECGKEISDKATSCPNCGCPITPATQKTKKKGSCLAIILIVFGLLIFIGVIVPSSNDKNTNSENQSKQAGNIVSTNTILPDESKENTIKETNEKTDNTFIQTNEIYNGNDVTISVQGYNSDKNYITISFLIENNSALNLGFNAHAYSV